MSLPGANQWQNCASFDRQGIKPKFPGSATNASPLDQLAGSQVTKRTLKTISGQVDREFATETVDLGSIPSRVKPKTIKTGTYSFPT